MAKLGIADLLSSGPRTASDLAAETHCDSDSLYRFLRALASAGILSESESRRFALTPLSEILRSNHPHSLRDLALLGGHPLHWQAWGNLLDSVRTGRAAWDTTHRRSFFEGLADDDALSTTFQRVMDRFPVVNRGVVESVDLNNFDRIVDVGGGTGELARQIGSAYPRAAVVLFDREHVLKTIPADKHIEFVSGSFFDAVPHGQAFFLKFVLHDWDDQHAVRILQNCRNAMSDGGRVFVIEVVLPDDTASSTAKTHDVNMLVLTGGRERTLAEYSSLISAAGLALVRITRTPHGVSVLELS
jgi:hypothetical protein